MHQLEKRCGASDVETTIMGIIELLTLRRADHKSIDDALIRVEVLRTNAGENVANFNLPVAAAAWLLVEALGIPHNTWPILRQTNAGGNVPTSNADIQELLRMMGQQGHIAEHTHAGPRDLYEANRGSKGKGRYIGIPDFQDPWHQSPSSDPWATGQT
eukprot:809113-Karenia_brevis.AAC.1